MTDSPADFAALPGGALVVGGSGGLGRAIAELLIARGATVATTHRSRPDDTGKASYPLILIAPNNYICLFAGASGMRIGSFFAFAGGIILAVLVVQRVQ